MHGCEYGREAATTAAPSLVTQQQLSVKATNNCCGLDGHAFKQEVMDSSALLPKAGHGRANALHSRAEKGRDLINPQQQDTELR